MAENPTVSVGMPVYNEGRFLAPALESVLAQDLKDFELIISDNASTDGSSDVCAEFARRDARIRYNRNPENRGQVWNFNRVFELSAGKYFMWTGAHDLWHPSLLTRCLSVLESDPSVVMCYPLITCIDEEGRPLPVEPTRMDTRSMGVSSRLNCVIWGLNRCDLIYSPIRRSALRHSRLIRPTLSPDNIIVAELSLVGSMAFLPEPLFFLRYIRKDETYAEVVRRGMATYSSKPPLFFFPSWRFFGEHILAVLLAPVKIDRKPVLLASVLFGVLARRSKHMMHDVTLFLKRLAGLN